MPKTGLDRPLLFIASAALFVATVVASPVSLRADVLETNDGQHLIGDVKRSSDGYRVATPDGKVTLVRFEDVKSIQLGNADPASSDPNSAASTLASLRRSVEHSNDLKSIIDRYQHFIASTKDAKALADAQSDLALWQERLAHNLIKVGSRWVTPEVQAELVKDASRMAEDAFPLVMQSRWHDADALLQQALDQDPQNLGALYLHGVVQYRSDQLPGARKTFETLNAVIADHAPTLNNLAVILWRQNQIQPALNLFDQAMIAAPVNKLILDNVAEALHGVPEDQKRNPSYVKASRHFADQEPPLQEGLRREGLYRWGSSWVDKTTYDDLQKAERALRDKMQQMQADFDAAQARASRIDGDISIQQDLIRSLEVQSYYRNPDGTLIRLPYPTAWYDAQARVQELRQEQSELNTKMNQLRTEARTVQNQLPKPKFTGALAIIGAEGAPMKIPPLPAPPTQPTTAPDPTPLAPSTVP